MRNALLKAANWLSCLLVGGMCLKAADEGLPWENAGAQGKCLTGNVDPAHRVTGQYAIFKPGVTLSGYPKGSTQKELWLPFDPASPLTDGRTSTAYEWDDREFGDFGRDLVVDLGAEYFLNRVDLQCDGKRLHEGWLYVKPVGGERFCCVRHFGRDDYVDVEENWRLRTRLIRFDKLGMVARHLRLNIRGSHQPRLGELRMWGREAMADDSRDIQPLLRLSYDPAKLAAPAPVEQVPAPDATKLPVFGDGPRFKFRGVRLLPPAKGSEEFNARLLQALAALRFNYVIHEGLDWAVHFHAWKTGWGGAIDVGDLMAAIRFNRSLGMETIGSWGIAPSGWVLALGEPARVEARPGEAYRTARGRIDFQRDPDEVLYKLSRVNACPLHPENFKTFQAVLEELCDIYRSEYFFGGVDEPLQWYNGSRWGCCPRCRGQDPVQLMADWVNKCSDVIRQDHRRIHLYQTTILLKEHQGEESGYPGGPKIAMYQIIDRIPRENVALVNWSYDVWRREKGEPDAAGLNRYLRSQGFNQIIQNVGYTDASFELCRHVQWAGQDEADFIGATVANYGSQSLADMAGRFKFLDYVVAGMCLWNPDVMKLGSREVAGRIVNGLEMFRQQIENVQLPSRLAKPDDFFHIDLQPFANRSLMDEKPLDGHGWVDLGPGLDLQAFPTGRQTLCGIPFSLSEAVGRQRPSCVMVENANLQDKTLPDVVQGIPLGRKAASLVFLHALTDGVERSEENPVVVYRMHFSGGLNVDFPGHYRREILEWLDQSPKGVEDLRMGWFLYGARPAWLGSTRSGQHCIVYAAEWVNPYPQFDIESVEFLLPPWSSAKGAALFGITGITPTPEMIANAVPKAQDGKIVFTSKDPPIILSGTARGDRTEGELTVLVPVVGIQARKVQLAVTINDWDNPREGKIYFNARELEIEASGGYNGVDHTFTVDVSIDELKSGFRPNIVKAVWLSSAGFDVKKAEIIVTPRE